MAVVDPTTGEVLDSNVRPPFTPEGIPQGMSIFDWLFQLGIGLEGDPDYYETGEATEAEFSNLFSIAQGEINKLDTSNPVRRQYYEFLQGLGAIQGDPGYYARGEAEAGEFTNVISTASKFFAGTGDGTGAGGAPGAAAGVGVLPGGQTIRVRADGQDRYYQVYQFPPGSGNYVSYQFNDLAQAESVLGKNFDVTTRQESWYNQFVLAEGAAEEVAGQQGSWSGLVNEIMRDAAAAAGVRDPSLVGRIASNPEMQNIMAQAVIGDWTPQQMLAEQRKTNFWKNELYPGIENLYTRTDNPERAYREYVAEVSPLLEALGYQRNAQGKFDTEIQRMLDNKIEAGTFLSQAPTYQRAVQNAEFAGVLNQWAEDRLGRSIDFNDWFDLMAGQSQPELDQIAEEATLAWTAQNQGTQVSEAQIRDLAARSQLSEQEAVAAFSNFNRAVLATNAFRRSELSQEDVLSAMAGIAPTSGRSIDEVRLEVAKLAREEDLFDEEKINFYVGFSAQGTPNRPGLQALAPEGA